MMQMPKVSVIIPCFNRESIILDTLHSVIQQTLQDWECIVVDDGSMDQSVERVRSLCDERIKVIQKENGGTASARQLGLTLAQGEYIQFLDSDDLLSPDKLERQITFMEQNHLMVSYSGYANLIEDNAGNTQISYPNKWTTSTLFSFRFSLLTRWGGDYSFPLHSFIYNRQFLMDNGLDYNIPIRQREDWCFHLQVSRATKKIEGCEDLVGAYYRHHIGCKTSSYLKMLDGNFKFMAYVAQELRGMDLLLLSYRISAELWLMVGRIFKYREFKALRLLPILWSNKRVAALLPLVILLLPLSLLMMIIRSIIIYSL